MHLPLYFVGKATRSKHLMLTVKNKAMRYSLLLLLIISFVSCLECPECSSPPREFQFQIVDILHNDLTRGKRAIYDAKKVRLMFEEYKIEQEVLLQIDTFYNERTIFSANYVPDIVERGITKFRLQYAADIVDTVEVKMSFVKSHCCDYSLYDNVKLNSRDLQYSDNDKFVFLIDKRDIR